MSVSSWLKTCHLTKFKHLDFPNSFFPAEVLAAGTENAENSPGSYFKITNDFLHQTKAASHC